MFLQTTLLSAISQSACSRINNLLLHMFQYAKTKPSKTTKAVAVAALVITAGAILSTLFIKQQYIANEITGIAPHG